MVDRTKAPVSYPIEKIDYPKADTTYLKNGIPLHIIRAGKEPVLILEIVFKAGKKYEHKPGTAYFTAKMLAEGTKSRSAAEISEFIDGHGAFLETSVNADFSFLQVYMLEKYAGKLIPLIYEILTEAAFDKDELENLRNIKFQQVRLNKEKNDVVATQEFMKKLFGEKAAYGSPLKEEDISAILQEDLEIFYPAFQNDFDIIISGEVNDENISIIDQYFGDTVFNTTTGPVKPAPAFEEPSTIDVSAPYVVNRNDKVQSSIRMGKRFVKKDHKDFSELKIANTILGGYFGSRLMSNIREEKGLTYGIGSALRGLQENGYLMLGADVKKENTQETINEIKKEIYRLINEPVPEEELSMVRNYMAGQLLFNVDTPFALIDQFKSVYFYGLDYSFYDEFLEKINNIDALSLQKYFAEYFNPDKLLTVVVGGLE